MIKITRLIITIVAPAGLDTIKLKTIPIKKQIIEVKIAHKVTDL
jgi:hypothetical protein